MAKIRTGYENATDCYRIYIELLFDITIRKLISVYKREVAVVISWSLCMLLLFSHHTHIYSKHTQKKNVYLYEMNIHNSYL